MRIKTITLATALALCGSLAFAPANAATNKHRHHANMHRSGTTIGMARTGPSGPRMDAGGVDKSRVGGQGVSRKAPGD